MISQLLSSFCVCCLFLFLPGAPVDVLAVGGLVEDEAVADDVAVDDAGAAAVVVAVDDAGAVAEAISARLAAQPATDHGGGGSALAAGATPRARNLASAKA